MSNVLLAGECFEMGRHAYLIGEDNYAVEWLDESLRKYETEKEKTASIKDILQFSAFSSYKKGSTITMRSLRDLIL